MVAGKFGKENFSGTNSLWVVIFGTFSVLIKKRREKEKKGERREKEKKGKKGREESLRKKNEESMLHTISAQSQWPSGNIWSAKALGPRAFALQEISACSASSISSNCRTFARLHAIGWYSMSNPGRLFRQNGQTFIVCVLWVRSRP